MIIYLPVRVRALTVDNISPYVDEPSIEISYNPDAKLLLQDQLRSLDLNNIKPLTIVCGVRSYFSLLADTFPTIQTGKDKDSSIFMSGDPNFIFSTYGLPVQLDPYGAKNSICVTCGTDGMFIVNDWIRVK